MRQTSAAVDDRRRYRAAVARPVPGKREFVVPPEVLLGYRLWQAYHLWQRQVGRYLKAVALTPVQYILLAAIYYLATQGEIPSQIRLSNFTGVEKMMVSKNLRLLVRRGYLSRRPGLRDKRVNQIRLTRAGARVLQRAFITSAEAHATFFHVLGEDWRRINSLLRILIHSHIEQPR